MAVEYYRYLQTLTEEIIFGRDMTNVCLLEEFCGPIPEKKNPAS
jgi:hypothetical protein